MRYNTLFDLLHYSLSVKYPVSFLSWSDTAEIKCTIIQRGQITMLPKTTFQFIFHFVRRQSVKFTILIATSIIWAINDSIFPYFLKRIVNTLQHYQGDRADVYHVLTGVLVLLMLFWIVTECFLRVQGIVQIYTFPRFRANIREAVFSYVKSHSHEYFSSHFAGTIAKKIADLPTSCQSIMEAICFNFVTAATGVVIVICMMWVMQPIFAAVIIVWLCLHLGVTILFLRSGNLLWEVHSSSVSALSGKVVDVFSNMLNVRLFARGKYEMEYLKKYQESEIVKAKKAMWLVEIARIGMGVSGLFLIFSMVFLLIHGWIHHWVTLGDFTQVGMQTFWLLGWVWFVSFQITIFAREFGVVGDALKLVVKGHDVVDMPNAKQLHVRSGEIRFDNVTFGYHKKKRVFDHLNITIKPGEKVGLVGFSGSGKSTFVNLILRFYDLNEGHIWIDGQDIATVTQDSLRESIAMIPQDPTLFHRQLIENIRYGRLNATDEEVVAAAKLAHCDEFITKLEDGYHAMVGERGIKLSGGQRQRIVIARAILKNAPILILDEATSALDTVTEQLIQESLHGLMQHKTTIVVAHRLSTLINMDRILVFHKGKVVEDGDRESLLQANGHFARLWAMQMDGFLPDGDS